jgi:cytochrome b
LHKDSPAPMRQTNVEGIANSDASVKVWDLPVRLFHWTLVAGFIVAYLTAKYRADDLHVLIGYALCLLLAARVFWGFSGSQYARFSSFVFSPSETLDYFRSMFGGYPRHYFGHNPVGALMVFALLALLALIFATGLATLAAIDFEGPLLALVHYVDDETSYAIRHLHEFLSDFALAMVVLHVMGVAAASIQHNENLVRAMVTGKKLQPSHKEIDKTNQTL